jgi:hypothetical protein
MLTDVIPFNLSAETDQNSEPSIAASPCTAFGPNLGILISTFANNLNNPFFGSGQGGTIYAKVFNKAAGDITLEWNGNTTSPAAYLARLYDPGTGYQIAVEKSETCLGNPLIPAFALMPGSPDMGWICDQPWLEVATVGGVDRVYVGFNDLRGNSKTATVRYFGTDGANWKDLKIERVGPGAGQDSPAVRTAAAKDGQTVYALFERWNSRGPGNRNFVGDVVVVKEANAANATLTFGALGIGSPAAGQGTRVASGIVLPWSAGGGAWLGDEKIGGDCAIAVDPNNPNLVYVAYTEVVGCTATSPGTPYVRVHRSTDGGLTFGSYLYTTSTTRPSALPALAVAKNDTVGLLLTELNGVNLETHFVQFENGDFSSSFFCFCRADTILKRFPNGTPAPSSNPSFPYIGDYQDLEVIGNRFFGVFSAGNGLGNPAIEFPVGVEYQRQFCIGGTLLSGTLVTAPATLVNGACGTSVPISIDPFSFSTTAASKPIIIWNQCCPYPGTLAIAWDIVNPHYGVFRRANS